MSSITNWIVLAILVGLFVYLLQPCQLNGAQYCVTNPTYSTPIVGVLNSANTNSSVTILGVTFQGGITGAAGGLLGAIQTFFSNPVNVVGVAIGLAIGLVFYPNPWLIFLVPAIYISGWLIYPSTLFNAQNLGLGSDPNIILFFTTMQTVVLLTITLAFISWFKGQETIGQ